MLQQQPVAGKYRPGMSLDEQFRHHSQEDNIRQLCKQYLLSYLAWDKIFQHRMVCMRPA